MDLRFWNWFNKPANVIQEVPQHKASAISFGQQNQLNNDIYKAYIPEFLYRPYFGFPRSVNVLQLRKLAKNPYIFSVVKTIYDEISTLDFKLEKREGVEITPELEEAKQNFLKWIEDPNGNPESWNHILRATIKDILELDSGVWVKVFNNMGQLTQIYARDGGAFLMNPNIYGYMGDRADYIKPSAQFASVYGATPNPTTELIKQYEFDYNNVAAYYQYGYTNAALPVPYGKREIVYFMQNPRTDNIYGTSPIEILADIIVTLIDGARYNLDFYMNRNLPDGILKVEGIQPDQIESVRARLSQRFQVEDEFGYTRNVRGAVPITGLPAEFINFNINPADMEIIGQQEWFTKIVWMCFGVNANEMGFTDSVNKASSEEQSKIARKKALAPILNLISYKITHEIMNEEIVSYEDEGSGEKKVIPPLNKYFKFKFDDYNLDEDIKKHTLYEQQIRMGIKTSEMVAEELGIDVAKLTQQKDEQRQKEMDLALSTNYFNNEKPKGINKPKEEQKSIEQKADDPFKPIKEHIKTVADELKKSLEHDNRLELDLGDDNESNRSS